MIVPDQRGYNLSDKPCKVSAYHLDELMQDIIGLEHALGYQTVYLAGHDWGGIVGWWLADKQPQILRKLAILNVPYPSIAVRQIREGNMAQRKKSRYVLAAQIPWLAEKGFARQNEESSLIQKRLPISSLFYYINLTK